jgi:hypothetical protein
MQYIVSILDFLLQIVLHQEGVSFLRFFKKEPQSWLVLVIEVVVIVMVPDENLNRGRYRVACPVLK